MTSELQRVYTDGTPSGDYEDLWCDPLDPKSFCNECGKGFVTTTRKGKFCKNSVCGQNFNKRRFPKGAKERTIKGAVSELLVAADLLKRKYHVFRAQNPDAKVDLIIDLSASAKRGDIENSVEPKGKRALRVEVKTGRLGDSNDRPMVTCSDDALDDRAHRPYDILAVVLEGGEVAYNPNPECWGSDPFPSLALGTTNRTFPYLPANSGRDHRIEKLRVSRDCKTLELTLRESSVINLPIRLFRELDGKQLDELMTVVLRDGYVIRWPKLGLEGTAEQLFHGKLNNAPSDVSCIPTDAGKDEPLEVTHDQDQD